VAKCDLTTARKGKTMMNHMTGDSEVERDLRKMKTAPQALMERTMTDFMRPWITAIGCSTCLRAAGDVGGLADRLATTPIIDTLRTKGRPTAQWSRLKAGRSDNLGTTPR
jgi:hypothetical protein